MTSTTTSATNALPLSQANPQRDYQIAWAATFLFFIAYYALIVPLPRYLTSLGLPDWEVGLVLGATAIASLVTRPISGVLTDRFGHKRMLLSGATALTIGAIGVVLTTHVVLLFGLRILQALGYVIFTTAGNALVGQLATPAERSQKIAYFGLAANFAMTMTPGATDLLLPLIGLTTAFWLSGGIAASAGVVARALRYTALPERVSAQPFSLGAFWRFPQQLGLSMLVSALFGAGFGAYFQYFAVLLDRRSIPAPAVFATYGISIIITRLLFGRYLDRIGFARVLVTAALMMAVGLVIAAYGFSLPMLILAAALIATGGGFFHPLLIAHHVTLLPERPGWAVACFYFGFDLGIGGGAWLLGAVLDLSGLTALYLTAAVLTLATLCLIPALAKQRRVALGDE